MKLLKMYKLIKISIVQIKSQKFLYKLSWSNRWMFSPIFHITYNIDVSGSRFRLIVSFQYFLNTSKLPHTTTHTKIKETPSVAQVQM